MSNTISIEQFEGEYQIKYRGGQTEWSPCQVVGVNDQQKFVILIEDADGSLWVSDAETVRRT